jgi:hypothetical protein
MTNSVAASLTFLYNTLTADSTFMAKVSGVYRSVAPEGSLPDYCMLIPQNPNKVLSAQGKLIMANGLYQVKMVGPMADFTNLTAAYDQALVDLALVHSVSGILACYCQSDLYYQEEVDGVPWCNIGGLFRIQL